MHSSERSHRGLQMAYYRRLREKKSMESFEDFMVRKRKELADKFLIQSAVKDWT